MDAKAWAKDIWVLCLMVATGLANFIIFGLVHWTGWKDAADYSAYAKNLLQGHGYSLDGVHFNLYREPGTPFYLIPFYKLFGIETELAIFAAMFVQALLLGLLGFVFYRIMTRYSDTWLAVLAGVCVSFWPILGDYTTQIGAEAVFTFTLGLIFFICTRIMRETPAAWHWFVLLGIACGWETLMRVQFILFLPFIIFWYAAYLRYSRKISAVPIRNALLAFFIFAAIPLSFATYIYAHTGKFAITEGRQEEMLYYRADRASLSYGEITRYLHDWLLRSISGGYNSQFLTDHEFHKLGYEYGLIATTSEAVARIKSENIRTILSRPGHYLYGNLVEMIKLAYLEHDYSDTWNRYFWPSLYAILYAFFFFGLYKLVRTKDNWDIRSLAILAILFLVYNYLSLSFVSVVPRFNTPYLPFYILIGSLGAVLYLRGKETAKNLKLFK